MNELVTVKGSNVEAYRTSTEAADMCKGIVLASSSEIQGRKFVSVEGWQAIAIAHGCVAGSRDVEKVDGGVRAIGEVRRMSDGQLIATAEGFVGEDEAVWYGGTVTNKWGKTKDHDKRPDYAIRAMAQTRAISRACRSAFAHVVVMMNAGLATTPAEEVPPEGFDNGHADRKRKLDGPYNAEPKLETAAKEFVRTLNGMDRLDEFIDWVTSKDVDEFLVQLKRDLPEWWNGGPSLPSEFIPLRVMVSTKKRDLEQIAELKQREQTVLDAG